MRWLNGSTDWMDMSLSKLQGLVMDRESGLLQSMGSQSIRHSWVTELKGTELTEIKLPLVFNFFFYLFCSDLSSVLIVLLSDYATFWTLLSD